MSNLFASLPASPGAVATDTMTARKTITAAGIFAPGDAAVVEIDPSGLGDWDVVKDESGQGIQFTEPSVRYADTLGFEMRFRKISGGGSGYNINVGAELSCPCQSPPPNDN